MMNRAFYFPLVFLFFGSVPCLPESTDDGPNKVASSPSLKVPLRPEWFRKDYNEVRDLTTIQTKEQLGPGNPIPCDHGEAMKMDIMGILEGKALGPDSKFTAKFYFHRMAGICQRGDMDSLKVHLEGFQPLDQDTKKLLLFADETTVYFMTRGGKRFKEEDEDVGHETQMSKGFLGEVYLWEDVTASLSWSELRSLADGGRVAIGDRTMMLGEDQISLIRTLIMIVEALPNH